MVVGAKISESCIFSSDELWRGDLQGWPRYKLILFGLAIMLFPLVWIIFSLPLDNKYNRTPFVRFYCNLASHVYFMLILIAVACWPIYPDARESLLPFWIEWLLLIWIFGEILEVITDKRGGKGFSSIKVQNT